MRKIFLKNLILLQGLNLIIKPLWLLVIDRKAQLLLGSAYSEYYIIFNLAVVLNILLDIGIQSFNNTGVAADQQFFKVNFKKIAFAKLLLALVYFATVAVVGLQSGLGAKLLLIIAVNQILTSFVLFFRSNINGLHHYTLDSILSVSDKFFGILFCIALFFADMINVYWFAGAQLLATGISFIIALYYNLKYHCKIAFDGSIEPFGFKALLIKSLPFALLFALMGFYTRMDVLMMKWLLPDYIYHCGVYAQSFRFLDAAAMFAMLFSGLLLPMFSLLIKANVDVRPLSYMSTTLLSIVSLTVASAAIAFGEDLLYVMYHIEDPVKLAWSASVFSNIMSAFVPMSLIFVFSTLLTAKRDLKYLNIFAFSALCCNLILNLILIPAYQSKGASISSLCTQSLFAILCIARCFYLFKLKLQFIDLGKYALFIGSLAALSLFLKGMDNVFLSLLLYGGGAVLLVFMLRIIDLHHLLITFKGRLQ